MQNALRFLSLRLDRTIFSNKLDRLLCLTHRSFCPLLVVAISGLAAVFFGDLWVVVLRQMGDIDKLVKTADNLHKNIISIVGMNPKLSLQNYFYVLFLYSQLFKTIMKDFCQ